MTGRGSLHGNVNAALNRLCRDGVIAQFKTNFMSPSKEWGVHVIVAPPEELVGERIKALLDKVAEALEPLSIAVTVTVTPKSSALDQSHSPSDA